MLTALLVGAGTAATLVLIIDLIAGGFTLDAGPFRLSSHNPSAPIVIAAGAWLAAFLLDRERAVAMLERMSSELTRRATAIAVVLAAAAAGVGVAYNTYSASASDSSGYVSQAQLLASGRLVRDEPLAAAVTWPQADWAFSPLGYRPSRATAKIAPGYPPGLPLAMAVAFWVEEDTAPFLVVPLLGAVAVLCTYLLGVQLHSRLAGLAAASLLASSPIVLFQIVQPMSDVPAMAWWTLALVLALSRLPHSAVTSGAVASGLAVGAAVLTRPNLLPLVVPVAMALAQWRLPDVLKPHVFRRLLLFSAGAMPGIVVLLFLQWRRYGSPFSSGYGRLDEFFALSNMAPNAGDYLGRLATGETAALTLAAASTSVLLIARRRPPSRAALRPATCSTHPVRIAAAALAASWVGAIVVASYLAYGVFPDWSSLRFLLPAFPPAFVVIGALVANASSALPRPVAGLAVCCALVAVSCANVAIARREQAFNLNINEERYRTAGRYLAAMLPDSAVVVALQQGGSARFYARRPVVRWDLLAIDLDIAIDRLRQLGRRPVFLVEEWEPAELRARFPSSRAARLDWPPRAAFGVYANVRLFDPADMGNTGPAAPLDRVR